MLPAVSNKLWGYGLTTWFYLLSSISIVCFAIGIYIDEPILLLLPFGVLVLAVALLNFNLLFYLLVAAIPISINYQISDALALNLPTEPLMAGFLLLLPLYFLLNPSKENKALLNHPLILLLILMLVWLGISTIFSTEKLISLKFFVAKCWFICSFGILTALVVKNVNQYKIWFWCFLIPLILVTIYILLRHYNLNFSFAFVNRTMSPFFRNHVDSAVTQVAFLPFVICSRFLFKKGSVARLVIDGSIPLLIVGIYYSYTRAAIASIAIIVAVYFIVKFKLMYPTIIAGIIAIFAFVLLMQNNNAYLNFAPDYKKTIYHGNWKSHLKATISMQDISAMERVYRWVAGFRMVADKPIVGFGPGAFYKNYKKYTISSFKTYVSDNPEKSTVHNYYLLILIEQGIAGLIILLSIILITLIKGQQLYHSGLSPPYKYIVMASLMSFTVLLANNFLGDLVEVDKTGSLFFMNIAFIISIDLHYRTAKNVLNEKA